MEEDKRHLPKGRFALKFRGTSCLNCGHTLDISDRYCPNCAQINSTKKLALRDFVDEFLNSVINYDSRLWQTFYALLLRPGKITTDYIAGKRISYTNPFRFLLSLAFIYFILFAYKNNFNQLDQEVKNLDERMLGGPITVDFGNDPEQPVSALITNQLDSLAPGQLQDTSAQKAVQLLDSIVKNDPNIPDTFKALDSLQSSGKLDSLVHRDSLMLSNPKQYFDLLETRSSFGNFLEKVEFFTRLLHNSYLETFEEGVDRYDVEDTFWNRLSFQFAGSVLKTIQEPGNFINGLFSRLPFVVFFFLPLFTIFIFLVYIRKNFTYTDHLIFSFHNQSLLFILLILSMLIDMMLSIDSSGIFVLIFGIYLYKAMRKFYGQNRWKTILKFTFLNAVFTGLAILSVLALLMGSVVTY
jgi:hypothetical protein